MNVFFQVSGIAQWLQVAVTQGPDRRFEFSEGLMFFSSRTPTSQKFRIMAVTTELKDGSGLIDLDALWLPVGACSPPV